MTENLTKKIKKRKGFTLIELIIVVAIIAILAALAIPKLMGTQDNAKKKADIANGKMIHDTVAKLVTEGSLNSSTVYSFDVASGSAATGQSTTWNELQSKPKATYNSYKGSDFHVEVSATGDITVTVKGGPEVYPVPASPYNQ